MEWPQLYVLILAAAATALLALEKAQLSVLGIGLIVAVGLPGLVSPNQAIAGFSNTAVVTVAALYILGEGFLRTGAASSLANRILQSTNGREVTVLMLVMVMAAVLSAFVNNILVVITFMPVITSICRDTGLFPSRLLIPLSYASIVGGMCTLVGTSTNLLVSGVLEESGMAPLGMFEMSMPGLLMVGAGMLYLTFVGRHSLPRIPSLAAQMRPDEIKEYVTEVTIGPDSKLIGTPVSKIQADPSAPAISMLIRREIVHRAPFQDLLLEAADILLVSGDVQDLASFHSAHADTEGDSKGEQYDPSTMSFFELSPTPTSTKLGVRLRDLGLKQRHDAVVIGLLRYGDHLQARIGDLHLLSGDVLLAFGNERSRASLRASGQYNLIEGVDEKIYRRERAPLATGIVLAVVTMFVTGLVHPCIAALLGALAMVSTGCLSIEHANRAVNWPIIMFIAGTLALSRALQNTGADQLVGDLLVSQLGGDSGLWLLAGIFLLTVILTELLSNNAVAVMMVPVALAAAEAASLDHRPLVLAVALGASTSFANPMGYKTNLLVLGPGGYRFRDFVRIGLPMDLLLAGVGIFGIWWFFPF